MSAATPKVGIALREWMFATRREELSTAEMEKRFKSLTNQA